MSEIVHACFAVGPLGCNCVVVGDASTGEALVIDPGGDLPLIQRHLAELGLRDVRAILHTHAHFDHVGATAGLQRATGAPVLLHEGDLFLIEALEMQARWFGMPKPEPVEVDRFFQDEEVVPAGAVASTVLFTPGHTPGSVSFLLAGGPLVSGDTLFAGGVGRTDLPGGDWEAMLASIRDRLLTLDDDVQVVPGHGPLTTIGAERARNPFLRGL